jgi:hypothetical protein
MKHRARTLPQTVLALGHGWARPDRHFLGQLPRPKRPLFNLSRNYALAVISLALMTAFAKHADAQVTYTYTGKPLTVQLGYQTGPAGLDITMTVTAPGPLAPSTSYTLSQMSSWTISAGSYVISSPCMASNCSVIAQQLGTDAQGDIATWDVDIEFALQNAADDILRLSTSNVGGNAQDIASYFPADVSLVSWAVGSFLAGTWSVPSSGAPPTIASALPVGLAGAPYPQSGTTAQLVSGGTPPYQISVTGLPAGLTVSSSGNITGTLPPGSQGAYTLVVTATDAAGNTGGPTSVQLNVLPSIVGTWYGWWQDTTYPTLFGTEQFVVQSETPTGAISGYFTYTNPTACQPFPVPCNLAWTGTMSANGLLSIAGLYGYAYPAQLSADGSTITGTYQGPATAPPDIGTWTVTQTPLDALEISNAAPGRQVAGWVRGDLLSASGVSSYTSRVSFGPVVPANGIVSLNANYSDDPSPAGNPNEVVAFTLGQLPQYIALPPPGGESPTWTPLNDLIPVTFAPSVTLPIKFWDVSTFPSTARTLAAAGLAYANGFYFGQRSGVNVQAVPASGVTTIPGAPFHPVSLGFSNVGCADLNPTSGVMGTHLPEPNALNVYMTDVIANPNGDPDWNTVGLYCGGAILLAVAAVPQSGTAAIGEYQTLAHEIGHALSLEHPAYASCDPPDSDNCAYSPWAGFTPQDLMWPVADQRVPPIYLTSGQVFRTTFDTNSLLNSGNPINTVLGYPANFLPPLRTIQPTFTCDAETSGNAQTMNPQCPMACKDVWGVGLQSGANACPRN